MDVEDLVCGIDADLASMVARLLALEELLGEGETATALRAGAEGLMAAADALARHTRAARTSAVEHLQPVALHALAHTVRADIGIKVCLIVAYP